MSTHMIPNLPRPIKFDASAETHDIHESYYSIVNLNGKPITKIPASRATPVAMIAGRTSPGYCMYLHSL